MILLAGLLYITYRTFLFIHLTIMSSTSIRLNLILERFSCPITEEQAWGICYLTACELKSLPGPWIFTPNNINKFMGSYNCDKESDELPMEAVLFNRSGQLKIDRKVLSSRFENFDSGTSSSSTTDSDSDCYSLSSSLASNATEYDLMGPLAVMLYKALDYRLEDSEERELDPSLSSLIEAMLEMEAQTPSISSPCFGDGDLPEISFDFNNRPNRVSSSSSPRHCFKTPDHLFSLSDLMERCRSHYFEGKDSSLSRRNSSKETLHSYYLSVCKGMVDEYYSCNLNLDNLNFNEGMRSWDKIVQSLESHEYDLKQPDRFQSCARKEPLDTVPEVSDLDALQSQIRSFQKHKMKHVETNSHERGSQALNPFAKTLDNIKNMKYKLKPLSERVLRETPESVTRVSTPHEMLMEQIQQPPTLREVPPELKRRYTLDLHKQKYQKQFKAPKRYYPPKDGLTLGAKTEDMDEYDIQDRERQAIVHGRSVSLPYERVNKLRVHRVPIQLERESSFLTDPVPLDNLNWSRKSYSPTLCVRTDSFCSLDNMSGRDSYFARPSSSASADMLDLPSSRGYTRSTSRDTMMLSGDESSLYYPDGSDNLSVYGDPFFREISPFAPSLLSMESSRSLENRGRRHKKNGHSHSERPSTSTFCDSKYDRIRSPLYNSGVSQLQELCHLRYNWTQSQLAELAYTHPCLYQDTLLGKICYVCNMKFNWKRWSTHCKLCSTKICASCKTSKVLPASFFECSQIANSSSQQTKGKKDKKLLVCQHCNFFLCNEFNETSSFFK